MADTLEKVLQRRFDRRSLLGAATKAIPLAAFARHVRGEEPLPAGQPVKVEANEREAARDFRLLFQSVTPNTRDEVTVPAGYRHSQLIGWGDPLFADVPAFEATAQTAAQQSRRFGYNVDWLDLFPLPGWEVENPRNALLVVNHEYTNPELMFKNWGGFDRQTREESAVEIEAHGLTVVEIFRDTAGRWRYLPNSIYNRRITGTTMMRVTGPAAGSDWLRTANDINGTSVMGTLNNCSGGKSPWGTALSGEENFHQYFSNAAGLPDGPAKAMHARYGMPTGAGSYPWARHFDRFDVPKHPNEAFRFGWVVEFDPYDAKAMPKKRTALGRFRHEGATIHIARNGKVVLYSGDDERFQFFYKYVSSGTFNAFDRAANESLLDNGTLYVAKLNDDGTGEWLPLVHGQGPLTAANGYRDQADVLVDTRGAAARLGATGMDRPEDMETNPVNGKVYLALTNNTARTDRDKNAANPRANNRYGHIIEITEDDGDHTATKFNWEIFILCGDGKNASHATFFAGYDPQKVSDLANPDNITFDNKGNLWISTDGQPSTLRVNDGVYAVATEGPERGNVKQFLSLVPGAEAASLVHNADSTALFVSVQHPGEGGKWTDNTADAVSLFPDGKLPNRPGIIVVTKATGSPTIGS
ncbi:MAG: PhoX family phosphatase [Bryobacterales bacterium]|nr:PhoX family phosphatase [Bryobacterales bacterium]